MLDTLDDNHAVIVLVIILDITRQEYPLDLDYSPFNSPFFYLFSVCFSFLICFFIYLFIYFLSRCAVRTAERLIISLTLFSRAQNF